MPRWGKGVDVTTIIFLFFFFLYILLHPLMRIMCILGHTGFAVWLHYSCKLWLLAQGPPVNVLVRRTAHLLSSLQMTPRKECLDTKIFPRLLRGSNPWPLALKASALTTRLPCFQWSCYMIYAWPCVCWFHIRSLFWERYVLSVDQAFVIVNTCKLAT